MPCYQVNTITIEFKAENCDLLFEALERTGLGYVVLANGSVCVTAPSGRTITLLENQAEADKRDMATVHEIKRMYSRCTLEETARVHRMIVVDDPDEPDVVILRAYVTE